MKKLNKGFTLIELIVSISILIIIGSISIMGYTDYLAGVRDTNRITELDNIQKLMSTYILTKKLPEPDNGVNVFLSGGTIVGIQGYAGESVLSKIGYIGGGLDTLDKKYYTYYRSPNMKFFQLAGFLEKPDENTAMSNKKIYAIDPYKSRFPKIIGDKLGLLLDSKNNPIQEITSIKTGSGLNISTTTGTYTTYLTSTEYISGDYIILNKISELSVNGGNGCNIMTGAIFCIQRTTH